MFEFQTCERAATMFAMRACLAYCARNRDQLGAECDIDQLDNIGKLQKLAKIDYCAKKYDAGISRCAEMM